MKQFTSYIPTKIIMAEDGQKKIGELVAPYAKKVMLVYGGQSLKKSGTYDEIVNSLKECQIEYCELGGVLPNPKLSLVYEGIRICREEKVEFVLAAGGGSVIDTAKAIAAGVNYDGDVWDFFVGGKAPSSMLPVGVLLTIPAAGSEAGCASVITKEETTEKRTMVSEHAFPVFAVLNPKLCYTIPKNQIAAGGIDIFAHVMERYFEPTYENPFSDRLCEATMKTVFELLPKVLENSQDFTSWANLMWAGSIAHNGILGSGRSEDWASHNIEHELSAEYDIAHGAGLAIVIPAWMRYVYTAQPGRFLQFAERIYELKVPSAGKVNEKELQEQVILHAIEKLEEFFRSVGLATKLKEVGIHNDRFEQMADRATANGSLGNFMSLDRNDVINIYNMALK